MLDWLRRWLRGPADALAGFAGQAELKLIVGLGNPGAEFADTRHNLGFVCVERLARRLGADWADDVDRTGSLVAPSHERSLVLAKPQTYMNNSGLAVRALLERLALAPERLLVVYDEMDLPLGALRLRERGSAGTHNGMRSLVKELGTERFARLRIGIGQWTQAGARGHVLSDFLAEERPIAEAAVQQAADAALSWATEGAAAAMNRYNNLRVSSSTGAG